MRRAGASLLFFALVACAGTGIEIPEPRGELVFVRLHPGGRIEIPGGAILDRGKALAWLRARAAASRKKGEVGLRVRCLLQPGLARGAIDRFLDLCQSAGVSAVDLDL